jgi:hypothetical protein
MPSFLSILKEAKGQTLGSRRIIARPTVSKKNTVGSTKFLRQAPKLNSTVITAAPCSTQRPPLRPADGRPRNAYSKISQSGDSVTVCAPVHGQRDGAGSSVVSSQRCQPTSPPDKRPVDLKTSPVKTSSSTDHTTNNESTPIVHPQPPVRERYILGSEALRSRLPYLGQHKCNTNRSKDCSEEPNVSDIINDHSLHHHPKSQRRPRRLARSTYETMNLQELLEEARLRSLDLASEDKQHLVEILALNDESYFELFGILGNHIEAAEFGQIVVQRHSEEVRRAAAEEQAKKEQAKLVLNTRRLQETHVRAEHIALENDLTKNKLAEQAAQSPSRNHQENQKRRDSHDIDSGYSSKSVTPLRLRDDDSRELSTGQKRSRPADEEDKISPKKKKDCPDFCANPATTSLARS